MKITPREKGVSPFLAWGEFHARLRFARCTIPEDKCGTTRSLLSRRTLLRGYIDVKSEAQGSIFSNAAIMTHSNYWLVLASIEVFIISQSLFKYQNNK